MADQAPIDADGTASGHADGGHLLARWPGLADRLGDRRQAFLDKIAEQATRRGLDAEAAARYGNLCCAFGPAFEDKPENEWALALLADQRLKPDVRLHQLLLRARQELLRRGGDEALLASTDTELLDALDQQRLQADDDAPPVPRSACDIEAVDLRLLDIGWRMEYRIADGQWERVPLARPPEPLRIDAQRPAPALLAVLSHAPGDGPQARLQLRQLLHGGCGQGRHPAVRWVGAHGLMQQSGASAAATSWPQPAPRPAPPSTGLGLALAEEAAPDVSLLQLPSCGHRDAGVPLGEQSLQLWTYPAQQWLYALQRDAMAPVQLPAGTAPPPPAAPATRCRIERDGQPVEAKAWLRGFDTELPAAFATAVATLFDAWSATVRDAALQAQPSLFDGRQVLTWGWREGAGGLAGEALLRVAGELDLGIALALTLSGTVEVGSTRSALTLAANGTTRLKHTLLRERAEPALAAVATAAVLRFAFPFTLRIDPCATDDGSVCSVAAPCTGSVNGELGLRPRLSGGSGWQWYLRLASEPVLAPVAVHDPVLGVSRRTLALLPGLALMDWSLG